MKKEFSDTEIIIGCKEKNEKIIKYLINTYNSRIMRIAYNIIKDKTIIEDITQEAFIKFITNADSMNNNHNVFARLYIITRNLSISYIRKRNSRTKQEKNLHVIINDWVAFNNSLQEKNAIFERIDDIINNNLYGMMKIICIEKYINGLSSTEISKKYKCPPGTVGRKLYDARNIIKLYIENINMVA